MKPVLLISFLFSSYFLTAQNDFLGVKVGTIWSNVRTNTILDGSDVANRFVGGLTYQHQFRNGIYVGSDFLYGERGFRADLIPGSLDPCLGCLRVAPVEVMNKFNFNYFSIPLKVGIVRGQNILFNADIALVPSVLINARNASDSNSEAITGPDEFDLSAQIEAGIGFPIYSDLIAYGSLAFTRSLTSVTSADYFSDQYMFHQGVILSFGVRYKLTKE